MTKYNLPLTYKPKINGVINGTIRQTIRSGRKFKKGDLVSFHGWEGKPYRSKWSFRTEYFELKAVIDILVCKQRGNLTTSNNHTTGWAYLDFLAEYDGIKLTTGEELRNVLFGMNKKRKNEFEAQIIRW